MRTGQGHRIDVLPMPATALAPEIFPQRHWLLVTTGQLTAARQRQMISGVNWLFLWTLSPCKSFAPLRHVLR